MNTASSQQASAVEVAPPCTDGISELAFSPQQDLLAAASWDQQVRIWQVQPNGSTVARMSYPHDGPVLCCHWSKDGTKLASGGADRQVRLLDIQSGQKLAIQAHDAGIRCLRWFDAGNNQMFATGSWDRTLRYWDLRASQQKPTLSVNMPERVYAMDIVFPLLVVGTAERHIQIYNLANPSTPYKSSESPLKWQTRTIACFPNASGYAIGSIEGRVGIQYIDQPKDGPDTKSFSFKCHRDGHNVYSVNSISFHPTYGTFATAGADGTMNFWDQESKHRLKQFASVGNTVSATAFSRTGSIFAYAASYDWSKGHEHNSATRKNRILLYAVQDNEIKPRSTGQRKR